MYDIKELNITITEEELAEIIENTPKVLKQGTVGYAKGMAQYLMHGMNYLKFLKSQETSMSTESNQLTGGTQNV